MPPEDDTAFSYALVERSRSSGTYSVAVISEMPGNAETVEVLNVDLPSDTVPGADPDHDARVFAAAANVLTDADYQLTSAWRLGNDCYIVGVAIPDRYSEKLNELLDAAATAVEGLTAVDETQALALFETAEITHDGDLGTYDDFHGWLEKEVNLVFYQTADGRLLARRVDRFERPSSMLFSDRYRSATLTSVFPNPRPVRVADEPDDDRNNRNDRNDRNDRDGSDDLEDEQDEEHTAEVGDDAFDAFPLRYEDADVPWPVVQRLNARRARQFQLVSTLERDPAELGFNDRLLARGHSLAFYAGACSDRRELLVRHYGGPWPRILPSKPPQALEGWDGEYRLVATYAGGSLFGENWQYGVSTMPLESFLTVHVQPAEGEETEYALRVHDGVLELLKDQDSAPEAVTVLGAVEAGADPLAVALAAVPDLLAVPPTAAVDITTTTPHAVADAIRFTSSPGGNTWEDLYGQDWDDYEDQCRARFRRHDDLIPLRLDINGTPHLAGMVDGDCVVIPVDRKDIEPSRVFLSVSYDFDGGGIFSGQGSQSVGEIRPGLNAYWEDFTEENWDRGLILSRGDLVDFATELLLGSMFQANVVHTLIGGLDAVPEVSLQGDLEHYEDVEAFVDFEPHDEEGLRLLRALRDAHGGESAVGKRIEAYLTEVSQ
ncbi:hypothetical protein PV410_35150 [Streptomyces sp. PA03-5A]|nr:hypothetical protein [Streptomyces sp. PA03-5A]